MQRAVCTGPRQVLGLVCRQLPVGSVVVDKVHVLMSTTSRGPGRPSGHELTLTDVQAFSHFLRASAAEIYGFKTTAFKNACRHLGVHQWPYQRPRASTNVSGVPQDSVEVHVETQM